MIGERFSGGIINDRLRKLNKERMELLVDYHSLSSHHDLGKRFPINILVADDQEINQRVLVSQLRKIGYEAKVVNNGLEAVKAVGLDFFDIVFMDIEMPEMTGVEAVTEMLSWNDKRKQPYIIAYTTRCGVEEVKLYKSIGFQLVLSKPASIHDVIDVVLNAIKSILVEA
ncbi:MAG: response regulator [Bacteroidales bacterium]|nr:response regulator [Bacteroidales bacterium]